MRTDVTTGITTELSTEELAAMSNAGDPPADAAAAAYFAETRTHADFFHAAVGHPQPGERRHEVVEAWLAEPAPLPPWADRELLDEGARFFTQWGLEIGMGLFCCALPMGYAASSTAHVLDLTARLETDARRRVFETAQMVLDVTTPGGLEEGAVGHTTIRRVRLLHAGIRYLVNNDPRIDRSERPAPDSYAWSPLWGEPLSQEHLLGGLLAFSTSMLDALDALGVEYEERGAAAYMHLWSVVGYLLGVDPSVLPLERESARATEVRLRRRNQQETPGGRRLAGALLELLEELTPGTVADGIPAALMRHLCGDEVADVLAIPHRRLGELAISGMKPGVAFMSLTTGHISPLSRALRAFSREVLEMFVRADRHGERPSFAIPEHLHGAWDLHRT
ncbi:MAG TPA: oxygenase MpaB family protein [Mycobacteriales bacterium]|nr:oxygenase MpaB family protein [Mycobacteriales bacterium]